MVRDQFVWFKSCSSLITSFLALRYSTLRLAISSIQIHNFMKGNSSKFITTSIKTQVDLPNYGEALRLLKNTESLLDKKKKQIRVQALRSQRGSLMEYEVEHKKQLREEAQMLNQKSILQIKAMKEKERQKIEQKRKQAERIRNQNLKNRSKSRLEIIENKLRLHQEIRQKSLEHDQKMRQLKHEILQKNQGRCVELYKDLRSSRAHVSEYQISHVNEVRTAMSRERDDLMQRIRKRQKELEELNQEIVSNTTLEPQKVTSTSDIKSRDQLPYSRKSSYLKNRRKSISESKIDASSNRIQLF